MTLTKIHAMFAIQLEEKKTFYNERRYFPLMKRFEYKRIQ